MKQFYLFKCVVFSSLEMKNSWTVYVGNVVGEEGKEERSVVHVELLCSPVLAELLGHATQEYGGYG